MLGATLALAVVVLGATPSSDPSALVLALGSPRFAQRESAELDLSRLGRGAIPALRAAKDSKDPEVRLRVAALLAKIEGSLLVQATPIVLDFRDVPVGQAIRAINERSGLNLLLATDEGAAVAERRLTLQFSEPLSFWKGIDTLCEAVQLHYLPDTRSSPGQLDGAFALHAGSVPSPEPCADSGPFRVTLTHVHYESEVDLTQPLTSTELQSSPPRDDRRYRPVSNKQFYVQLVVLAEPRLSITQNGALKLTTAVDERDQSLVPRRESGTFQHSAGYFGMNPSPAFRLRLDLARPENAGNRIRRIQGTIPVQVASRRPDPLEITLAGSIGRTFRDQEATLAVRNFRPAQNSQPPTIEISIKPNGPGTAPIDGGEGEPLGYRRDSPQQQIEILDAQGQVLPWFPSGTTYNGDETRLTLTVGTRGIPALPAMVRYHSIIRATAEVPFEFHDVPMP